MNKSIRNLDDFINKYQKFIISTHESPDADGLACEIAFFEIMKQMGKTAIILNSDPTPEICRFIDIDNEIIILKDASQLPADIHEYAQFVLDTNDYDNTGTVYRLLSDKVADCFIVRLFCNSWRNIDPEYDVI